MHKLNQPQTTKTNTVRDAAAQIGDEESSKGELIRNGLTKEMQTKYPSFSKDRITNHAYGSLSALCAMLTGADRDAREWAKKEVRRLVKLGKEQA